MVLFWKCFPKLSHVLWRGPRPLASSVVRYMYKWDDLDPLSLKTCLRIGWSTFRGLLEHCRNVVGTLQKMCKYKVMMLNISFRNMYTSYSVPHDHNCAQYSRVIKTERNMTLMSRQKHHIRRQVNTACCKILVAGN